MHIHRAACISLPASMQSWGPHIKFHVLPASLTCSMAAKNPCICVLTVLCLMRFIRAGSIQAPQLHVRWAICWQCF